LKLSVLIPASGSGARFGANVPKQFALLGGRHILHQTILAFAEMEIVDEIIVAVPPGFSQTVADYGVAKLARIVEGGASRLDTVSRALGVVAHDTDYVFIHDGVRPFITEAFVNDVLNAVREHGAAIACAPVTDTIKRAGASNIIEETCDRSSLWQAQTPQGFTYKIIMNAYSQPGLNAIPATDDSSLVERLGVPVHIVPNTRVNMKITTPEDLLIAEAIWGSFKGALLECEK